MSNGYCSSQDDVLAAGEFRSRLSEVIDRAEAGLSTIVTANGEAVGAFVPMEVLEWFARTRPTDLRHGRTAVAAPSPAAVREE